MTNKFIFKGIQLVKALPTQVESGVLYFVREHDVDGNLTGNAKIYFGDRLYGEVPATELAGIKERLTNVEALADAAQTEQEVKDAISSAINALDLENTYEAKGAAADALTAATSYTDTQISGVNATIETVSGAVADNASAIAEVDGKVTGLTETFETYTGETAETLSGLRTDVDTVSAATVANAAAIQANTVKLDAILNGTGVTEALDSFIELNEYIKEHGSDAQNMLTAITANHDAITALTDSFETYTGETAETLSGLRTDVNAVSGTAAANTAAIEANASAIAEVDGKVTGLTETFETYTGETAETLSGLRTDVNAVSGTAAANTAAIEANASAITAEENARKEAISAVTSAITAEENARKEAITVVDNKVTGLTETFETYTGETKNVLDDIKTRLTAITENAVVSIASSGKTINVTEDENGNVNVEVNRLAHVENDANQAGYVILNATENGELYGVMYYGGDDFE